MYLIISGTNRVGSTTLKVAKEYQRLLKERSIDSALLSLEGLNLMTRDDDFIKLENDSKKRNLLFLITNLVSL